MVTSLKVRQTHGKEFENFVVPEEYKPGSWGDIVIAQANAIGAEKYSLNIGDWVAIKTPRELDDLSKARFDREIEIYDLIKDNPEFLKYFGSKDIGKGFQSIILEKIDYSASFAVTELNKNEMLGWDENVFEAVCKSLIKLYNAHPQKVYYDRDIKASNIGIVNIGSKEYYKLFDFGSAGPKDRDRVVKGVKEGSLTGTFTIHGTVRYSPPEHLVKNMIHYDYATETYSLGVTELFLLLGKHPFGPDEYKNFEFDWTKRILADKNYVPSDIDIIHAAKMNNNNYLNIWFEKNFSDRQFDKKKRTVLRKSVESFSENRYGSVEKMLKEFSDSVIETPLSIGYNKIKSKLSIKNKNVVKSKDLDFIISEYKDMVTYSINHKIKSTMIDDAYDLISERAKSDYNKIINDINNKIAHGTGKFTKPYQTYNDGEYIFKTSDEKSVFVSELIEYINGYRNDFGINYASGVLSRENNDNLTPKKIVERLRAKESVGLGSELEKKIAILIQVPSKEHWDTIEEKRRKEDEEKKRAERELQFAKVTAAQNEYIMASDNIKRFSKDGRLISSSYLINELNEKYDTFVNAVKNVDEYSLDSNLSKRLTDSNKIYKSTLVEQLEIIMRDAKNVDSESSGAQKKYDLLNDVVKSWKEQNPLSAIEHIEWNKKTVAINGAISEIERKLESYKKAHLRNRKVIAERRKEKLKEFRDGAKKVFGLGLLGATLYYVVPPVWNAGTGAVKWTWNGIVDIFTPDPVPNKHPKADFTYQSTGLYINNAIKFMDNSKDSDGKITRRIWDFDNDGKPDFEGNNINYKFSKPGSYPITLEVWDDSNSSNKTSKIIEITKRPPPPNRAPTGYLDANKSAIYTGESVILSPVVTDSDGKLVKLQLDIENDGTIDYVSEDFGDVQVKYEWAGIYHPKIIVTDDDGASSSFTKQITVLQRDTQNIEPKPKKTTPKQPSPTYLDLFSENTKPWKGSGYYIMDEDNHFAVDSVSGSEYRRRKDAFSRTEDYYVINNMKNRLNTASSNAQKKVVDNYFRNVRGIADVDNRADGIFTKSGQYLAKNFTEFRKFKNEFNEKNKPQSPAVGPTNGPHIYERTYNDNDVEQTPDQVHKQKVFDYFRRNNSKLASVRTRSDGSVWSEEGDSLAASITEYRKLAREYNEYEKSLKN